MKRVMIDLETMSTRPTAAVIALTVAMRDDVNPHISARTWRIDPTLALGHVDEQTCNWWSEQNAEVKNFVWGGNESPTEVFSSVRSWIQANGAYGEDVLYYGDPADFDFPIIRNQFFTAGIECPWEWSQQRCSRTMRKVMIEDMGIDFKESENPHPHHPYYDTVQQLNDLYRMLGLFQEMKHPAQVLT